MAPPIHPNLMTALRLPLAPIAVGVLLTGTVWGVVVAAILSLVLEATDLLDGWIARKYGVVSDFGKLFDPFADSFCRFTLFLGLYAIHLADLWMILVLFYRDSTVAFLRGVAASQGIVVPARQSGKIKAVIQGVGTQVCYLVLLVQALVPSLAEPLATVPWWTMLFITLFTAFTLVDYLIGNRPVLETAWNDGPPR
jgi:CDP-diacylglycerol--glycerol-3-phosphate 3-phosphatidyltransferase